MLSGVTKSSCNQEKIWRQPLGGAESFLDCKGSEVDTKHQASQITILKKSLIRYFILKIL